MKAVFVAFAILVITPASAGAAEPDPLYPMEQFIDLFEGAQQAQGIRGADQSQPFGAHPGLMPDWNNDGKFGNKGDYAIENSPRDATGSFRYPCIAMGGRITYRTAAGTCAPANTPGAAFLLGQARKLRIVDSLGWEMQAAIFLPGDALEGGTATYPGVVFSNGAQAPMQVFYMYSMTLASQGITVLNFDPAGQGQSEDEFLNNFIYDQGSVGGDCRATRPCRETQDVVRWFVGQDVVRRPTENPGPHNPSENPPNPVLSLLDTSRIGIMGESMGSLSTSNYLWYLPRGTSADGRPLPAIRAAIGLSGFASASATVPFQMQTSDLDIPGYDADNFGLAVTDGPVGTKAYYDAMRQRREGNGALELIVIESGSHGDHSNATRFGGFGAPHAIWAWSLSTSYAADWMGCYLQDRAGACTRSVTKRPHLSRAQPSEYDVDGPVGPQPSRCITTPDKVTLQQVYRPQQFVSGLRGEPHYDCVR